MPWARCSAPIPGAEAKLYQVAAFCWRVSMNDFTAPIVISVGDARRGFVAAAWLATRSSDHLRHGGRCWREPATLPVNLVPAFVTAAWIDLRRTIC